jgi:ribose 5-phosphate isomerase B
METIAIGNDHAGTDYKKAIQKQLESKGYTVLNFGTDTTESVDYPDFVHPTAQAVEQGRATFGIVICGSGNGVAITANKHQNIRAALCWTKEIAELARQHNNANILAIPARYTSQEQAIAIVDTFLNTTFEAGRHQNRIEKIACR